MTHRIEERTPLRLTALVWGSDGNGQIFMEQVETLDISPKGARLKGISYPLKLGAVLGIQNGDNQGRFEVVWIGEKGSEREGQVGVRCIQVGRQQKKTLLYIDDQDFELERRAPLMEAFGYDVQVANSAQAAFDCLNRVQVQLVIVDQPFPGVDNVTFIDQILKTQPSTKILILSAFPSHVPERAINMADAFVHKGDNQNKFIGEIEKLVGPGRSLQWPLTRIIQRFRVVVPVSIRVLRSGVPTTVTGTSTDLSEGGLGVELMDGELTAGEIITIMFSLPTAPHPLKLYGMVRHRKMHHYGLQFLDVPLEDQQSIRDLCEVLVPMDVPQ